GLYKLFTGLYRPEKGTKMEKLKVKMALVLDQNFVKPLGTFCARGLPSRAAYQLGRCVKAINEANAEALALNDKQSVTYGEAVMVDDKPAKNEKGQPLFKFSEENQKIVDKERKDLMEVEVEL